MIREAIISLVEGTHLTESETSIVMEEIMSGQATDAQIGSFLTALRMKGETVEEITGAARVMRAKAKKIHSPAGVSAVVDTCGTGGDKSGTFNISTVAAFIAAGAGAVVAKHGNRAVSGKSGSADVLQALGVNIDAEEKRIESALKKHGIAFLFAPKLHLAMKYAAGPRKEMGIRTIFNLLGPLTNPAGANAQVVGVYSAKLTSPIARALRNLGVRHAFVVHGYDGIDEITLTDKTHVAELSDGDVSEWDLDPIDYGLALCLPEDLAGGDAETNAGIIRGILEGEKGPKRDVAVINAAAVLIAADIAEGFEDGVELAKKSIDSGAAKAKLEGLIEECK